MVAAGYVAQAPVTSRRGAGYICGPRLFHGVATTHHTKVPPQTKGKFHVTVCTVHRTAQYSNNKKYAVCSIVGVLCSAVTSTLLNMVSGL